MDKHYTPTFGRLLHSASGLLSSLLSTAYVPKTLNTNVPALYIMPGHSMYTVTELDSKMHILILAY